MSILLNRLLQFFVLALYTSLPLAAAVPSFGFLWVCVVRGTTQRGGTQTFVPGAIVGVRHRNADSAESFTVTDKTGYAYIPLRPGAYCAKAYDSRGSKLRLDMRTNRGNAVCFDVRSNEVTEAAVTISHDQEVTVDFPSKGIN